MSKLPYMQFYPSDYLIDTAVLSLAAQGAWMRILCALHASEMRGTKTWRLDVWARYIGVTPDVTSQILQEISESGVGNVEEANGNVTLTNRRMLSERITKEQTRLRVQKHRLNTKHGASETPCNNDCNGACNADVTDKKSEVRSQKSEETPLPPCQGDEDVAAKLPKQKKPTPAKGPLQLRAERLMRRRPDTPLTACESRAFAKNRPAIQSTTEDEWQTLEAFYAAPQSETFARKDLAALLNNWNGEIDRAKAWLAQNPRRANTTGKPTAPAIPEPVNWRSFVAEDMPTCPYAPGQPKDGCPWADVAPDHQRAIVAAMSPQAATT